jgi:hypothetical protein
MDGAVCSGTNLGARGNLAHDLELSSFVARPGMVGLVSVLVSFPGVRGRSGGVTSTIEPQLAICRYFTAPRDPYLESEGIARRTMRLRRGGGDSRPVWLNRVQLHFGALPDAKMRPSRVVDHANQRTIPSPSLFTWQCPTVHANPPEPQSSQMPRNLYTCPRRCLSRP